MAAGAFDGEAATFDERAGLSAEALEAIANAVARLLPRGGDGALLDLGAGTGALGEWLMQRVARYVGLDSSRSMLAAFSQRISRSTARPRRILVEADAAAPWPVKAGSFDVVFSSRAFHRFPLDHAVEEVFRAAVRGGALLVGGIRRDPTGAQAHLRRRLHDALRRRGLSPRDAESGTRAALDRCRRRGGRVLAPVTAARWTKSRSVVETLEGWRRRIGLAGVDMNPETKAAVLAEVESSVLSPGARPEDDEETYVLEGALLA